MIAAQAGTVLITGGAIRVGKAIALHLAAKGWNVAIHYHHSEVEAQETLRELQNLCVKATAIRADLTAPNAAQSIFVEANKILGSVTALINNAAAFTKDSVATLSHESWVRHMETNLLAPLMLSQAFAAQLPKGKEGAIINLLDGCEGMCLSPQFLTYSLSKEGLRHATLLLAKGLAPNIRVNAIAPGLTLPKEGEEAMFVRLVARLPVPVATTPDEIANAVSLLLESPSATGQVLAMNGGAGL